MKRAFAFGVVIGSTLLALGVAELFVGYWLFPRGHGGKNYFRHRSEIRGGEQPVYQLDPEIGYRPTPNSHIKRPTPPGLAKAPRRKMYYDLDTDIHGFRYDGDLSASKQANEVRVFSLGGSTTFGAEVPNRLTYPQQLEHRLADPSLKVVNAACGGFRSIHIVKYYERVVRPLRPDIITVFEGWNDYEDFLEGYWKPNDPTANALSSQFGLYYSTFALEYAVKKAFYEVAGYNRREDDGSRVPIGKQFLDGARRPEWQIAYEANFQRLIDLAKSDGVVPVLLLNPAPVFAGASAEAKTFADNDLNMAGRWDGLTMAVEKIRAISRRLAETNKIPIIDIAAPFEELNSDYKKKFSLFVDRMHLTAEGNALIANAMYPTILELAGKVRTERQEKLSRIERSEAGA